MDNNDLKWEKLYICAELRSKSDKYQSIAIRDIPFIPVDRKLNKYFKIVLLILLPSDSVGFVYIKDNFFLGDQYLCGLP